MNSVDKSIDAQIKQNIKKYFEQMARKKNPNMVSQKSGVSYSGKHISQLSQSDELSYSVHDNTVTAKALEDLSSELVGMKMLKDKTRTPNNEDQFISIITQKKGDGQDIEMENSGLYFSNAHGSQSQTAIGHGLGRRNEGATKSTRSLLVQKPVNFPQYEESNHRNYDLMQDNLSGR